MTNNTPKKPNFWPERPEIDPAWYAIKTRSRHEAVVRDLLAQQGHESFLPVHTKLSQRKDRRKLLTLPMFPGYLFIHTNLEITVYHSILKCHGVVDFLRAPKGPLPANPSEIESLRILVQSGHAVDTGTYLKKGDLVEIIEGPFTGVIGRLVQVGPSTRLVVSIELMNQSARVELDQSIVFKARGL